MNSVSFARNWGFRGDVRLLTLTSIYIWHVRDIYIERVCVANTSLNFLSHNDERNRERKKQSSILLTACIVFDIRQLTYREREQNRILSKEWILLSLTLYLPAHKICNSNLSGNLKRKKKIVSSYYYANEHIYQWFNVLTTNSKGIIQYGNWWKWHCQWI